LHLRNKILQIKAIFGQALFCKEGVPGPSSCETGLVALSGATTPAEQSYTQALKAGFPHRGDVERTLSHRKEHSKGEKYYSAESQSFPKDRRAL